MIYFNYYVHVKRVQLYIINFTNLCYICWHLRASIYRFINTIQNYYKK